MAGISASNGESSFDFSNSLKNMVGTEAYHDVCVVLQNWFKYQRNIAKGLPFLSELGGNSSLMSLLFAGLVGIRVGADTLYEDNKKKYPVLTNRKDVFSELSIQICRVIFNGTKEKPVGYSFMVPLRHNLVRSIYKIYLNLFVLVKKYKKYRL